MWLGTKPQDARNTSNILYFEEYLKKPRRERRIIGREIAKKGSDFTTMMNYAPIKFTKKLEEFPTNKEFGLSNWVEMKTRMTGDDEMFISDLSGTQKLVDGKMVDAYSQSEILIKFMLRMMVGWSFADENGTPYPITEENVRGLLREDFDYLAGEFGKLLNALYSAAEEAPAEDSADDLKTNISEAEKNSLSSDSNSESEPSERKQAEQPEA